VFLTGAGIVVSYAGAHTCSMKSKAVPIEFWLDRHYEQCAFLLKMKVLLVIVKVWSTRVSFDRIQDVDS
jgi:hypothetical protein